MKLALESTLLLGDRSGVGNYAYHLAAELCRLPELEGISFIANGYGKSGGLPRFASSSKARYRKAWVPQALSDPLAYAMWHRWYLGAFVKKEKPDIIHFPSLIGGRYPHCRTVITVHDLSFETFYPASRLTRYYREYGRRSAGLANLIITDSQATRNDLIGLWGVSQDKIRVAPLGCGANFREGNHDQCRDAVKKRHGIDAPFILFAGNVEPRKNLVFLLKAFEQAKGKIPGLGLAVAGRRGFPYPEFDAALAVSPARQAIAVLGHRPADELVELYNAAACFCFPSLMEGFGLPVLEAFNCGCPVIASDNSSLPEVAGDGAVLLDANDLDGWAAAIQRFAADAALVEEHRLKGRQRAKQFSWERCARQTVDAYMGTV